MAAAEPRITIPLRARAEQRSAERFDVSMPVKVEGEAGVTCDLSSNGLAFEADRSYEPGEHLQVTIEYLMDGHNYPLQCEAEVVRCERDGAVWRVGARLVAPLADNPLHSVP